MPPLPGKDFFTNLTSYFKPSEHAESRGNDAHATAGNEDMDDDEAEQSSVGLKKRAREQHEEQSQTTKKKQRTYSQDDGAYFGHYNEPTPKDACKVMVPTNGGPLDDNIVVQPEKTTKVTKAPKPMAGGHKTKNTLSNSQPGRNGAPGGINAPFKQPSRVTKPAAWAPPMYGDGFKDTEQAPTRAQTLKRRPTNGASQASTGRKPIDIIDDSDEVTMGTVEAVNGSRISSDGQNSVIEVDSLSQSKWFDPTEMRNVQSITNPRPAKKRRQPSSAQGSNHNGSQSQLRPSSGHTNRSSGIEDLNIPLSRFPLNKASKPKGEKDRKSEIPRIDLGKGTDIGEIQKQKAERDIKVASGQMESMMYSPAFTKPHTRALPEQRSVQRQMYDSAYTQSHTGAPSEGRTLSQENMHHSGGKRDEGDVRQKFRRESIVTQVSPQQISPPQQQPQPRQSRAKAMQVTSSNGQSNDLQDSPDQLLMTSPRLSRKPADGRSSASVTRESPHQRSPSDLMPAKFTLKTTKSVSASQPSRTAKKLSDHADDEEVRIPLSQIYSRGCCLESGEDKQVELVWREADGHFEVEMNGSPCRVVTRDEIMSIGEREAFTWHYAQGSTKVKLRGSMSTGRSNGCILLQFLDEASRDKCADHLMSYNMTSKLEDAARLDKTFELQTKDLQEDAWKCVQKTRAESNAAEEKRHSSEEHIRYEQSDDERGNRVSARSRLLGHDTATAVRSKKPPYFQDQDHQLKRSTRQSKAVVERSPSPEPVMERWTQVNPQVPWHQSVMYPATGARRITVDFQDLERLDEGEFLNDNIVGYALRRIEENMAPEHKSKVHFFNSYFFTSLTSRIGRKSFNYDAVKKWTKQKDLFDIPYIVVPINENMHWYLAIICNLPSLKRKSAPLDDCTPDAVATPATSRQASERPSPIRDPVIPDSQDVENNDKPDAQAMRQLSLESDGASREGNDVIEFGGDGKVVNNTQKSHNEDRQVQAKGGKKSKKRTAPSLPKYPTDKPIIITLDSFGQAHTGQIATLKDYVSAEAMDKRGMEVGREDMKGMTATGVPLQQNFCDCGLYLVGYVAEFAKDPEGFVTKVLTRQLDGKSDFATFDPSKKRDEIRDDLLQLHDEQDADRLALKKSKKEGKNKVLVTAVSDASTLNASSGTRYEGHAPKESAQAPLTARTEAPPHSGKLRPSHSPGPDATLNARGKFQHSGSEPADDASENDEMESGMPRALTVQSGHVLRIPQAAAPDPLKNDPASVTKCDDGEMLDDRASDDAAIDYRPKGMRKVLSPELDGLSRILEAGPPPGAPSNAHAKHPDSEKRPA